MKGWIGVLMAVMVVFGIPILVGVFGGESTMKGYYMGAFVMFLALSIREATKN